MRMIEILMTRLVGYILHYTFGNFNENSLLQCILVAEEIQSKSCLGCDKEVYLNVCTFFLVIIQSSELFKKYKHYIRGLRGYIVVSPLSFLGFTSALHVIFFVLSFYI